jgi:hypothetical protein
MSGQLGDQPVSKNAQTVAPRVNFGCRVGMKTFGTKHFIDVVSKNISASGMLLKVDDPKIAAPFQNKTLLELVFYPDGDIIKEELRATAVVVRSVMSEGEDRRKEEFGIRIVEAPEAFEGVIRQFMSRQSELVAA